jgi:hypothetical protein
MRHIRTGTQGLISLEKKKLLKTKTNQTKKNKTS